MNVIQTLLLFFIIALTFYIEYNLIVLDKWPIETIDEIKTRILRQN
jgi:hypothetical protein